MGFQVIGPVMDLASKKHDSGEMPVLVRLAKGQAHDLIRRQVLAVLGAMHRDSGLDHGSATSCIVSTAVNLSARFGDYLLFPFKLALCVAVWNPDFEKHIRAILDTPEEFLDVGFALQVQRKAKLTGDGFAYLASPSVQRALRGVWEASGANSLDAERKHVKVKRNETSHTTHVGVAPRNVILRDYERERSLHCNMLKRREKEHQKAAKTNTMSLARQRVPWLCPMPRCRSNPGGFLGCAPAEDAAALNAWLAEHRAELDTEVALTRAAARAALEATKHEYPVTHAQWLAWHLVPGNGERFRALMGTETKARRERSVLFGARSGLGPPRPQVSTCHHQVGPARGHLGRVALAAERLAPPQGRPHADVVLA